MLECRYLGNLDFLPVEVIVAFLTEDRVILSIHPVFKYAVENRIRTGSWLRFVCWELESRSPGVVLGVRLCL